MRRRNESGPTLLILALAGAALLVLVVGGSVGLYFLLRKPPEPQPPVASPSQPPPVRPEGPPPEATHEAVVREAVASMRRAAEAMDKAIDTASAEQAVSVVNREAQNLQRLRRRLAELGQPSRNQVARVKQLSPEIFNGAQAVTNGTAAALGRIQAGRFDRDLSIRLATASQDFGQAMVDFSQQARKHFD